MSDVEARMAALGRRFVASTGQQAAALRTALTASDRERVAEVAHHLAGAAGIFGERALGEKALMLEESIDRGADDATIMTLADNLLAALDRLAQSR